LSQSFNSTLNISEKLHGASDLILELNSQLELVSQVLLYSISASFHQTHKSVLIVSHSSQTQSVSKDKIVLL
jgi:hypothetical protein